MPLQYISFPPLALSHKLYLLTLDWQTAALKDWQTADLKNLYSVQYMARLTASFRFRYRIVCKARIGCQGAIQYMLLVMINAKTK
jgi:hypothetical protein